MSITPKDVLELLKQPARYAFGIGAVVAFVLFSPDWIINKFGLLSVREKGQLYLSITLLICIALIIAAGIEVVGKRYKQFRASSAAKNRLQNLTREEKNILSEYIEGQTRTAYLPVRSGVTNGLVTGGIISRSSHFLELSGEGDMVCPFNIQEWAWSRLNKHRDLLR